MKTQGTRVGAYRGYGIYHEADGWWAENDGGTCFGPFDDEAGAECAVDGSDRATCAHMDTEYKIHLDQIVCRCGMRRDVSERGHGTDWLPRDYWISLRQDDHFMRGPDCESIAQSIEGLTLHGPLPGGLTDGERQEDENIVMAMMRAKEGQSPIQG